MSSLTRQLVLAIMGLTLLVLLATLLLARWSFERSFAEYVSALERNRLRAVADYLLAVYVPESGWKELDERTYLRALRVLPPEPRHLRENRKGPYDLNREGRPQGEPDFLPGAHLEGRRGPPPPAQRAHANAPGFTRGPPPGRMPPGPRASRDVLPTVLENANGDVLFAHNTAGSDAGGSWVSLPLDFNGERIGTLRSRPAIRLQSVQESEFASEQFSASVVIFCAALLLAAMLSLFLARRFLSPLMEANVALGRLAAGEYEQRIESPRADELGELVRDIDRLTCTLKSNRDARQRWIADISHELRTPVTLLRGELEAIADGIRVFDHERLLSLQAEVRRLEKLIDDLYQLSLADIGGLRYEFTDVDVSAVLRALLEERQRRFQEAGMQLTTELGSSCHVRGDCERLVQLFSNLLENSIAYTDSPGEIRVRTTVQGASVEVLIEDSAPGVPAESYSRLFDPLYRAEESRSRRTAGAGLGLAISRAVIEGHAGTIQALASELGGLALCVRLPGIDSGKVEQ
ncbi:MAG: ATP-binding protein [Pseudomonadota bacterium]